MKPYSYLVDVIVYNGNINDATWRHHAYCSSAGEASSNDNAWVKRMYMFKQVHWSIKYFIFNHFLSGSCIHLINHALLL